MKKVIIMAFAIILLGLSGCSPTSPQSFTSEEGAFSVVSPLSLQESSQSIDTQLGPIEVHFFMGEDANRAFMVGYSDYPQDFVDQSDPQVMLDGAVNGAVSNVNGELVSEVKIHLSDRYPGREIVVTAMVDNNQEGTLKGRLFLVNNRLYQIMSIAPSDNLNVQEMDDFINSFELLNP
jgi:hypothetical protein